MHAVLSSDLDWGACREVVAWLLAHGADVNYTDAQGCGALDCAVWLGAPREMLQLLIEQGGRKRERGPHGDSLLHDAVRSHLD